jgi:hypothetical protein
VGWVTNLFIRARVEPPELEVTVSTGGRGEDGDTGLGTLLTASISHHCYSTEHNYFINSITSVANKVQKTLISTVLRLLFEFLSLKNDVKVPSKSNMQENLKKY